MDRISFVTALFDIGRGNLQGQYQRPFKTYQERFYQLLSTTLPFVVFGDDNIKGLLEGRDKTFFVKVETQSLKKFPLYDEIQKIRTSPEWLSIDPWLEGSPQALLELYNPLVMSKLKFLDFAIRNNPFQSKYFIWLDAGVVNTTPVSYFTDPNFVWNLEKWLDKILLMDFPYKGKEIHGFPMDQMNFYAGHKINRVVRATMFGGEGSQLDEMNAEYKRVLYDTINEGYMGTEENILTILRYLYPKKFNVFNMPFPNINTFLNKLRNTQTNYKMSLTFRG